LAEPVTIENMEKSLNPPVRYGDAPNSDMMLFVKSDVLGINSVL
jgi:hypothetical protein